MVYDTEAKRNPKILKLCRRYLTWVQNSVFEGELTDAKYRMLKREIEAIIEDDKDCVVAYVFRTKKYTKRETIGVEKGKPSNIV